MKKLITSFFLALFITGSASAATFISNFTYDGYITNHNDVVEINFNVAEDAQDVDIWTDSFMDALNFDPIIAVWDAVTGALIMQNDDNPYVETGQTYYDSGIELPFLAAGDYILTITRYYNFANGGNLADGFGADGDIPVALTEGGYWRVNYTAEPVPVPAAVWLFGSGLLGLLGYSKRRRAAI